MTTFRQPTRVPPRTTGGVRRRRANASFYNFGGFGSDRIKHVFTKVGYVVESIAPQAGGQHTYIECRTDPEDEDVKVQIGEAGTDQGGYIALGDADGVTQVIVNTSGSAAPRQNLYTLTGNTTLNTYVKNMVVSMNTSANTTITLQADADDFKEGTWIGFQDISGCTAQYNITIDPNSANSGLNINGSASPVTLIRRDYGYGEVRIARKNQATKNWFTSGGNSDVDYEHVSAGTTNTTMTYPDSGVTCNTSGGTVAITLPDATLYEGRMIALKKTTGDANFVKIVAKSGQTIEGSAFTQSNLSRRGYVIYSDGSDWWYVGGAST